MHNPASLTRELRENALESGIDQIGFTTVKPFRVGPDSRGYLIEKFGYADVDPTKIHPGAKAIVVAIISVHDGFVFKPSEPGVPRGRYFQSPRVGDAGPYVRKWIADFLTRRGYRAWLWEGLLPTKTAAVRAGIAQFGKNGTVHTEGLGNMIALGCIVTDAQLETVEYPDHSTDCGDCDACVRGCPTGAVYQPYCIDMDKCLCAIINSRRACPKSYRPLFSNYIEGCPACHDSCPLNRSVKPKENIPYKLENLPDTPELIPLLEGDPVHYKRTVRARWLEFPGKTILQRNAATALGNVGDPAGVPSLISALSHPDQDVRGTAAWALGCIGGLNAKAALERSQKQELANSVLVDISNALEAL